MDPMIGKRFGRLKVLKIARRNKDRHIEYLCKCDCGNLHIAKGTYLRSGKIKSCGCLQRELSSKRATIHGMSKTRTYKAWCEMKMRIKYPSRYKTDIYQSIGISEEWEKDFMAFYRDMGPCPEGLTLDRIDNTKGYFPGNCRWATMQQQAQNRRERRFYQGEKIQKTNGNCLYCGEILRKRIREGKKHFFNRKFCNRQCYLQYLKTKGGNHGRKENIEP